MGLCFNIEFSGEDASHWITIRPGEYEDVIVGKPYELNSEIIDGKVRYYITNEKGTKTYDDWLRLNGDYISY